MPYRDPVTDAPNGILPYVAAVVLLVLILLVAWYLMGRNQHSIEIVLPLLRVPIRAIRLAPL
jgi:hypothetical protein